MKTKRELSDDRIAAVLKTAAAFAPSESAPDGLAQAALIRFHSRQALRARRMRIAGAAVCATVICGCLVVAGLYTGRNGATTGTVSPLRFADVSAGHGDAPHSAIHDKSIPNTNRMRADKNTHTANRTVRTKPADAATAHRRWIPKARWRVATVHSYSTELITPAVVAAGDEENGTLVIQPAVLQFPIEVGEAIPTGKNTWRLRPLDQITFKEKTE